MVAVKLLKSGCDEAMASNLLLFFGPGGHNFDLSEKFTEVL